jgi:hypothetical protein
MAKQLLDNADVVAQFHKVGGKRMPERVRGEGACLPCRTRGNRAGRSSHWYYAFN